MSTSRLELIAATREQAPILDNLLQLYAHDFSEFHPVEFGADGRFHYQPLPLYWTDSRRHPFLIRFNGGLAGFVLFRQGSEFSGNEFAWDVVEFFILRGYRRRGLGTQAAHGLWTMIPGDWEVRVMENNRAALAFWTRAITKFTGGTPVFTRYEKDGESWRLFAFESHRPLAI